MVKEGWEKSSDEEARLNEKKGLVLVQKEVY
jgi:hypothetical protein